MALPQVIEIDSLLLPIAEDTPAGVDPRADSSPTSLYYQAKDARNAARSAERAAVEAGGPPPGEWLQVGEAAAEILSSQSKDLEIAAWLTEALLRLEGFVGLRDGFQLITGIVENYWDTCFPELDEDGIEGKVSAVAGLNGSGAVGTLIQPIRLIELTEGSQASYSLWNYEQASDLEKVTDPARRQERIDNGAVTMEQFLRSVAETSAARFGETVQAIEEAQQALARMSAAFDAVAGVDSPPISALREMLDEILRSIRHFAADKLASLEVSGFEDESADLQEVAAGGDSEGQVVRVKRVDGYGSREEALTEMIRIAGYFRKTEPHSPISYTLEEAVRRARMSLPELLTELAEDPAHIQRILLAAGIRPPPPAEAESGGW